MRQAGVLAAAGRIALGEMVDRLADDHRHARSLAEGLAGVPGVIVDPAAVETNIVHFQLDDAVSLSPVELCDRLREEHDIGLGTYPGGYLRAILHYWIGEADVETLVSAIRGLLGNEHR